MLQPDPQDARFMRRALELAEQGRGAVEPNPLCGAVLVQGGCVVAEGWHTRFGGPHAERIAIRAAGDRARGATLYVTLEPCPHHGKTPPCTDAILRAGVSRIVAAMRDPYPQVSGQGFEQLRQAGLDVVSGVLEGEARDLNAPYLKLTQSGLPYVHAKWAMTWDGKIASATGDSKWISGESSRREVHALRGRMDGIVVGIGTVLADDPLLTARPPGPRTPVRIVLDSQARLPSCSRLVQTAREFPVLVCASPRASTADLNRLKTAGCEVITLPEEVAKPQAAAERLSGFKLSTLNSQLSTLLNELGRRRMTNLLVEGGGDVLGSLFDGGLVDTVHVFLAPKLLGGRGAKSPVGGHGWPRIATAPRLDQVEIIQLGEDLYLRGRCVRSHAES